MLFGIALLYGRTGALNLAQIGAGARRPGRRRRSWSVAFALLACRASLVKAAVVPFHFWLADAYAVAPTPVCLLLAGGDERARAVRRSRASTGPCSRGALGAARGRDPRGVLVGAGRR